MRFHSAGSTLEALLCTYRSKFSASGGVEVVTGRRFGCFFR